MAKFVKKKVNVLVLILLLMSAALPGILYLIYCAIPHKIPQKAPKNNGVALRLIGSLLTLAFYIFCVCHFGMEEGLLAAIIGAGIGFSGLTFLFVLFTLKAKGTGGLTFAAIFNFFALLITLFFDVFAGIFPYLWIAIPLVLVIILTFVGISNGKKQVLYDKYADKEEVVEEAKAVEIPLE